MKATHKPIEQLVGFQKVHLDPGQFVFGIHKAGREIGATPRQVRTCLHTLKILGNLTIKPTNKFSIISINNWDTYQQTETLNDNQSDKRVTNKRQANDNKQEHKNNKNIRIERGNGVPDWIPAEIWADFKEFRIRKKAPLTARAIKGIVTKLDSLRLAGNDPESVLEQSIVQGWAGVFEIKKDFKKSNNSTRSEKVAASMDIMARREYERQREEAEIDAEARNRHDPSEDVQLLPS